MRTTERSRTQPALAILVSLLALACAGRAAAREPLRAGEVLSTSESGVWTLIQAKDSGGKEFWVWTSRCVIGAGGKVEVLAAEHHDRIRNEATGQEYEDCYVAQRLRLNGQEVEGVPAHQMPASCVVIRKSK